MLAQSSSSVSSHSKVTGAAASAGRIKLNTKKQKLKEAKLRKNFLFIIINYGFLKAEAKTPT